MILEAQLYLERDDPRGWPDACKNSGLSARPASRWATNAPAASSRSPWHDRRRADRTRRPERHRIGGVVSERHANFIIAEPECTSSDVLRLIDMIRGQVHQRLGVELELELEIW